MFFLPSNLPAHEGEVFVSRSPMDERTRSRSLIPLQRMGNSQDAQGTDMT